MSYPTNESPSTAAFWAGVSQIRGVRTNGQYSAGQFLAEGEIQSDRVEVSPPIEGAPEISILPPDQSRAGSTGGFYLYEITTQDAADKVNQLAGSGDSFWVTLLGYVLDPITGWEDAIFSMAGSAAQANDAGRTFWHDHHFAPGDRAYVVLRIDEGVGVTDYHFGLSFLGDDEVRFFKKGSLERWQMKQMDNQIGVLPDPVSKQLVFQITVVNKMSNSVFLASDVLKYGSWVAGKTPPEWINPGSTSVCQVKNSGLWAIGDLSFTTDFGVPHISFGLTYLQNQLITDMCACDGIANSGSFYQDVVRGDASGLPRGSKAWIWTLHSASYPPASK